MGYCRSDSLDFDYPHCLNHYYYGILVRDSFLGLLSGSYMEQMRLRVMGTESNSQRKREY